ncbi:hypothetical protein [Campylobacter sp.]|uniref:hypothetical protein n=1 Tax=Campylobacter sp. TaxID=205 RepID=UPI002A8410F4|nr:hypothetical protein [Campylobacter sp.]MCI7582528.1 hypothetical protein [Campylobacter sp.]MDY4445112.1 hypothetical protein [Campylobacter sp.]
MLNRFLFLMIISCQLGFAHSLKVFAKASDDTLEIKGYFYGGSACKGCVVELRDENGAFASLELDEQGRASVELPNKISFKIAVSAAGGHLKEIEFKNPNFTQNQQNNSSKNSTPPLKNTQNTQSLKSSPVPQNTQNELDEKSSVFLEFLKGFGSILAIFIIFGLIYFAKKKR